MKDNGGRAAGPPEQDDGPLDRRRAEDRVAILWRARRWIAVPSLAVALLAGGVSIWLPRVYESQAQVRVTVPVVGGASPREAILASNELAGQYAGLIDTQPVVAVAAKALGEVEGSTLSSATSASASGDRNVVFIRAKAGSRETATRRADAIADAFVTYIGQSNAEQERQAALANQRRLAPLDKAIRDAQRELARAVSRGADSVIPARQQLVTTLTVQRETLRAQLSQASLPMQPKVEIWAPAGPAKQIQPRPLLFAVVALGLALLFTSQVVLFLARRGKGLRS